MPFPRGQIPLNPPPQNTGLQDQMNNPDILLSLSRQIQEPQAPPVRLPEDNDIWLSLVHEKVSELDDEWFLFVAKIDQPGIKYGITRGQGRTAKYDPPQGKIALPDDRSRWSQFTMRKVTQKEFGVLSAVAAAEPIPGEYTNITKEDWCLNVIERLVGQGLLNYVTLDHARYMTFDDFLQVQPEAPEEPKRPIEYKFVEQSGPLAPFLPAPQAPEVPGGFTIIQESGDLPYDVLRRRWSRNST